MKAFVASQRHWLIVEQLPGYAYDLNPVEQIWGNLKSKETRQCSVRDTIEEAAKAADAGLAASATRPMLCSTPLLRHSRPTAMSLDHAGITRRS